MKQVQTFYAAETNFDGFHKRREKSGKLSAISGVASLGWKPVVPHPGVAVGVDVTVA